MTCRPWHYDVLLVFGSCNRRVHCAEESTADDLERLRVSYLVVGDCVIALGLLKIV